MSTWDRDNDGLSDTYESFRGTNPDVADSDGDTVSDGDEVDLGWDPLKVDSTAKVDKMRGSLIQAREDLDKSYEDARDMFRDTDYDGLDNRTERKLGLDPFDADTDHDGIRDGMEVELGLDPKDNLPEPEAPLPRVPMRLPEPAATSAPAPAVEPIEAEQLTAVETPTYEEPPAYETESFASIDTSTDDALSQDNGDTLSDTTMDA